MKDDKMRESANIDIQQKLLSKIFKKYGVFLAYIFGSAVSGEMARESDIDIAVLFSENFSKEKRFSSRLNLINELSKIFKRNAEVVVFNDISSLFFKYVIISEGNLVFEKREGEAAELESKIMGLYFDFQPFLELYSKQYVKNNLQ